jgi:hypothetical protein
VILALKIAATFFFSPSSSATVPQERKRFIDLIAARNDDDPIASETKKLTVGEIAASTIATKLFPPSPPPSSPCVRFEAESINNYNYNSSSSSKKTGIPYLSFSVRVAPSGPVDVSCSLFFCLIGETNSCPFESRLSKDPFREPFFPGNECGGIKI